MKKEEFVAQLSQFINPLAAEPIFVMLYQDKIKLKITKNRLTKLGDYRLPQPGKQHQITVNGNLNKHAFLITLIHEIAHLKAFQIFGKDILPHGKEWKQTFKKLFEPFLSETYFPLDVLLQLHNYFKNPKASTGSHIGLSKVLKLYDKPNGLTTLAELPENTQFVFRNKPYKKLQKQKTRYLCLNIANNKKYLFSPLAEVHVINS